MPSNIKVLFLAPQQTVSSARFRVFTYIDSLKKDGFVVTVLHPRPDKYTTPKWVMKGRVFKLLWHGLGIPARLFMWLFCIPAFIKNDVVIIQRDLNPEPFPLIEALVYFFNKRIIFDFDDSIFMWPWSVSKSLLHFQKTKIAWIVKHSQHIFVGNQFLKQWADKFSPRVSVLPTPVDTEYFKTKISQNGHETINIGWCGTYSSIQYINSLTPVLSRICGEYPNVKILISTNRPDMVELPDCNTDIRLFSKEREIVDFHDMNIGLMPIKEDDYSKGKCALKALCYMSCGIPNVCSDVGANREVHSKGQTGFLAKNEEDWYLKLKTLIQNPQLREQMGKAGRELVEKHYSKKVLYNVLKEKIVETALQDNTI